MDPVNTELLLSEPRGVCAGVSRAIEIVERALIKFGAPVYVLHEIVHNTHVIEELKRNGAVFVDQLALVPMGAPLVFSAHGVSKAVRSEASQRNLQVFDATCPLVSKVHVEVAKLAKEGYDFLMVGHAGHPEVEGTMGQLPHRIQLVESVADVAAVKVANPEKIAVVTQTTLSIDDARDILDAIRARFPNVREPKQADICYATQNRQSAVKWLAPRTDLMIVVGSQSSSNSKRLQEVSQRAGTPAYLVDGPADLRAEWFQGRARVGLTAGASVPDTVVRQVIDGVSAFGVRSVRRVPGVKETAAFPMVRGLRTDRPTTKTPNLRKRDEIQSDRKALQLRRRIEEALDKCLDPANFPEAPSHLVDAMRYSLLAGGKRLRARILLEASALCGNDMWESALPAACAVEMIHACSLILDDLPDMDNSPLRRGRPANHLVFGASTAILASLSLLNLAMETVAGLAHDARVGPDRSARATIELARSVGARGMSGGQELDLAGSNKSLPMVELLKIHQLKTSAFLTACARVGAILAGAGDRQLEALTIYGAHLGLAFQIHDDILDVSGTTAELGKPASIDAQNHKATFATLHGLEQATQLERQEVEAAVDAVALFGNRASNLRKLAHAAVNRIC